LRDNRWRMSAIHRTISSPKIDHECFLKCIKTIDTKNNLVSKDEVWEATNWRDGIEIRLGVTFNAAHKDMNCVENEEGEVIYELGKWESTIRKKQKRHKKSGITSYVDEIGVTLIGIRMADRQSRYRADESETITIIKIQQNTIFIEDRSKGIGALALCPWRSSHFCKNLVIKWQNKEEKANGND